MANPGKNKVLRWLRVFGNGYHLSCDARSVGTFHNEWDGVDMTGWCNSVRNSSFGWHTVGVDAFQALLNDATDGTYTQLKNSGVSVLSFAFGGGAEPTVGDPAYLMGAVQLGENTPWDGQAAAINASFMPSITNFDCKPWGVMLANNASISATTNYASVDNGAATTTGWNANLHVLATDSGDYAITIEQSATDAWGGEETTLVTFTADGSAITSERQIGTDSVARYVRARLVRTAGDVTPVITFARN